MSIKQVSIEVRSVGQAFGCEAVVRKGGKVLHTTRLVPYGQRGTAYGLAEAWARDQGYSVRQ